MLIAEAEPFIAPTPWFVYGHLHLILSLPTIALLTLSPPLQDARPLYRNAALLFVGFIVFIGVAQSFVWDSCEAEHKMQDMRETRDLHETRGLREARDLCETRDLRETRG